MAAPHLDQPSQLVLAIKRQQHFLFTDYKMLLERSISNSLFG